MKRAENGPVFLYKSLTEKGPVEYVLVCVTGKGGEKEFVVNAYIREYEKPKGKTYLCSMNYDRYNADVFARMVRNKLEKLSQKGLITQTFNDEENFNVQDDDFASAGGVCESGWL